MSAQILLVEDEDDFVAEIARMIDGISPAAQLTIARSRDEAIERLDNQFFDFAILDLRIPTTTGGLDADPEHGKYVFHHTRRVTPGTKILVLTMSPSTDFIADMLNQKRDADVWGEGSKIDTVEFERKIDIDKTPEKIAKVINAVHALDDIELDIQALNLSTAEERLVRIFSKRFGAMRAIVSRIGGGRSGARTLRLQLFDIAGAPIREVVAKLADLARIHDEDARYESHILLLNPASTPRKMAMLEFGAGPTAAVFYQLAAGHDQSMFAAMAADDQRAAAAVGSAAVAMADWSNGRPEVRRPIGDIRRCFLPDDKAAELQQQYGLDWAATFEEREIQMRWCCIHGDFHGENALVDAGHSVVLIDYGDVGHCAAAYDPVSLELSAVLQPNPTLGDAWPDEETCKRWNDLDAYVAACPMPDFIRACRTWAVNVSAGNREIAACAYAYLLRQLKYGDTNKPRILALLTGVREFMANT